MPQFSGRDVAVAVLVKVSETFDKVFGSVSRTVLGNGLQDGQEDLKVDSLLC